ncbi:MAG: glycosyltransferase family 4 protein, partial [Microcoleaceae cyanobacterium]
MHIAWLGKKTPFCGNVTYSREVTNALLDRGYQVSFLHFAQDTQEGDRKFDWTLPNSVWGLQMSRILGNDDEKTDNDLLDIKDIKDLNTSWSQSLSCEVPLPYLYKSQIYTIPSLKSSKVLKQSLKDLRPDIVHASLTLSPLDFLLPEICEELDLPLIATFHAPFEKKVRNFTAGTQLLTYQLYAPFLANYERVV